MAKTLSHVFNDAYNFKQIYKNQLTQQMCILTVILAGLQSVHGINMNVFETPDRNCSFEANFRAANTSEFPFPVQHIS